MAIEAAPDPEILIDLAGVRSVLNEEASSVVIDTRRIESLSDTAPVQVAHADNAVFLPEASLQLVRHLDRWFVASEGIVHPFAITVCRLKGLHIFNADAARRNRLDGDVCVLDNVWSKSYFHWFEELFKVVILEDFGFTGRYVVPSGGPFIEQSLEALGIDRSRLLKTGEEPVQIERLYLTSQIMLDRDLPTFRTLFFRVRARLLESIGGPLTETPTRRIWLDRSANVVNTVNRNCVNPTEVGPVLAAHGFENVDLGGLDFTDQIRAIQSSQTVASVHGAALLNAIFLQSGSSVIECFSPNYINACVLGVVELLDLHYDSVVANHIYWDETSYPYEARVYVPPRRLELAIRSAVRRGA